MSNKKGIKSMNEILVVDEKIDTINKGHKFGIEQRIGRIEKFLAVLSEQHVKEVKKLSNWSQGVVKWGDSICMLLDDLDARIKKLEESDVRRVCKED